MRLAGQNKAAEALSKIGIRAALDQAWDQLSPEMKEEPATKATFTILRSSLQYSEEGLNPQFRQLIEGLLLDWQKTVSKYDLKDPSKASANLSSLAADIFTIAGGALAMELTLGALPNDQGTVASARISSVMGWLGVGAVVNAVAHDPVKIALLRPWQDSLEATYRNRRPDDFALFQAYKTRELSPAKVDDLSKLDDAAMDKIEAENQAIYEREIAKWGYSVEFAGALSRSATVTLNFSQLTALARQGLLTRGLAIYSLWGQGLDRIVMRPALDALMKQNTMASYEGFRSLVEPSYVEGNISEADLVNYWDRIAVPSDVQAWILPRLRKKREATLAKQSTGTVPKERDLTVSQVQAAYQNQLIDRARSQNMILELGYSLDEVKILLDLAELRRKLPKSSELKRLPLSDYEKAFKNKLISEADVLQRMEGEYTLLDIALERALLEAGRA